jgi:Big-like domain-containing protein
MRDLVGKVIWRRGEANSTVKVYDGAKLLGQAPADGSGAWSYTTAHLANASHSLTAIATDASSNTSAASAALSVLIVNHAPVVTTPGKVKASSSQAIELSKFYQRERADNDAFCYLFHDSTSGGGHFEVNGVVKQAGTIFAAAASQLSQVKFVPA